MSLIHFDKSVLTFHLKEILEDGHMGGPLTIIGLSALIVGPKLLANLAKASRPTAKAQVKPSSSYRPYMSLSEWVAEAREQQASLSIHGVDAQVSGSELNNTQVSERLVA